MKRIIINSILLLFASNLMAQLNIVSPSTEELADLYKGKVIHKKLRSGQDIMVTSQCIVISEVRYVFDVIMDCKKHIEFVPNFKDCESLFDNGIDSLYGKIIVDPPMTKKDLNYYLFNRYQISKQKARISWYLDTSKPKPSYIENTSGFWDIQSLDQDKVLVTFYSKNDFDFHWSVNWLIEPILKKMVKSSLPKLLKNLRARVETKEAWKRGEDYPQAKILSKY